MNALDTVEHKTTKKNLFNDSDFSTFVQLDSRFRPLCANSGILDASRHVLCICICTVHMYIFHQANYVIMIFFMFRRRKISIKLNKKANVEKNL